MDLMASYVSQNIVSRTEHFLNLRSKLCLSSICAFVQGRVLVGELGVWVMTFHKKDGTELIFSLHFGVREDPLHAYLQKVSLNCWIIYLR